MHPGAVLELAGMGRQKNVRIPFCFHVSHLFRLHHRRLFFVTDLSSRLS